MTVTCGIPIFNTVNVCHKLLPRKAVDYYTFENIECPYLSSHRYFAATESLWIIYNCSVFTSQYQSEICHNLFVDFLLTKLLLIKHANVEII